MKFRTLLLIAFSLLLSFPSMAVTEKEMEEAKVTAAKLYLRWANNGSGYLDEISPKSMSDLESKLRAKEKENIKAFKAVSIPSDYSKWDKERFVQFWGTTFFTNPGLSADGKRAKDRVKAKVSAMKVTPPSAESKPAAEEKKTAETPAKEEKTDVTPATLQDSPAVPTADQAAAEQEKAVDEIEAAAEVEAMSAAKKKESHTWLYVTILGVLVVVVIWLMVYAANMMKKQGKEALMAEGNTDERIKKAERAAKESMADAQDQINNLKTANSRLTDEVRSLSLALEEARASELRLKEELASARKEAASVSAARKVKAEEAPRPKVITEIYLGRANNKGQFVRGDRRPNPDHTIYRLDTKDGLVGTFRVADTPETLELALSNPLQFLAGGCNSDNFEDAETATTIVTETPGTAILEGGCWKVIRKSRIRFE